MTGPRDRDIGELNCSEFVELVTDYLEDHLDPIDRGRFDEHLAACPGCARYLEQIRDSTRILGRVSLDTISAGARDQLIDAFRTWRAGRSGESG